MTTELVTRLAAAVILILAFGASVAVIVHGYWLSPSYMPPPTLSAIVGGGVLGAAGVLGINIGLTQGSQIAVNAMNSMTPAPAAPTPQAGAKGGA